MMPPTRRSLEVFLLLTSFVCTQIGATSASDKAPKSMLFDCLLRPCLDLLGPETTKADTKEKNAHVDSIEQGVLQQEDQEHENAPVDFAGTKRNDSNSDSKLYRNLITESKDNACYRDEEKPFEKTLKAFAVISTMLKSLKEFGAVDVTELFPAKVVVQSIFVLAKLQQAEWVANKELANTPLELDESTLSDLIHYSVYAKAMHGWKVRLLLDGKASIGDADAFMRSTGVPKENIVMTNWVAATNRPSYCIVRDHERKNIVLCIRGTCSVEDVLTDLCGTIGEIHMENVPPSVKTQIRGHHGFVEGAKGVADATRDVIAAELKAHPGYTLCICGQSLGAGTACALGSLWKNLFPGLSVFSYGCPPVAPMDSSPTGDRHIFSVQAHGDCFSTLSIGHVAAMTQELRLLCEDDVLRTAAFETLKGKGLDELVASSAGRCCEIMKALRAKAESSNVYPKFYPGGRIFYMGGALFGKRGNVTLYEVDPMRYHEHIIHEKMADVTSHLPSNYDSSLIRFWEDRQKQSGA